MADSATTAPDATDRLLASGSYCPRCGTAVEEGADGCERCNVALPALERLDELLETATKDYHWGEFYARQFPPLAVYVAWRQRKIEAAHRDLHEYWTAVGAGEHCRGCGESLEAEAAVCEHCGRRNALAAIDDLELVIETEADRHDPEAFETAVSDRWWYGVIGGALAASVPFLLDPGGLSVGVRALAIVLWIAGAAVAMYSLVKDRQYVRATYPWYPSLAWLSFLWLPGISTVNALAYLAKRWWVMRTAAGDRATE